jgi:quinol-cytochrome oxidoreductase complex cytochrome b subunit
MCLIVLSIYFLNTYYIIESYDLNRSQLKSISSKTKHYLIYFIIIIIVIVLSNTILNSINDLNNDNTFFYFITKAIIIYRLDINHILYYNQLNRFPNKLK